MDVMQTVIDRPVLSISSAGAVVAAVVWATLWVWSEFAHAGDVKREVDGIYVAQSKYQASTLREIQINRISGEVSLLDMEIRGKRSQLFELMRATKGQDQATYQRYDGELKSLESDRRSKASMLERLKAGVPLQ